MWSGLTGEPFAKGDESDRQKLLCFVSREITAERLHTITESLSGFIKLYGTLDGAGLCRLHGVQHRNDDGQQAVSLPVEHQAAGGIELFDRNEIRIWHALSLALMTPPRKVRMTPIETTISGTLLNQPPRSADERLLKMSDR